MDADVVALQRRSESMVSAVTELAAVNSGSFHAAGVDQVGELLRGRFEALGGEVELVRLPALRSLDERGQWHEQELGHLLRARKRPQCQRRVFLGGHLDTVFPVDHPFQQVVRTASDRLHGPGVADLKGGLVVMLEALAQLEADPAARNLGWDVVLNPDEEIGSPVSAAYLTEVARHCQLGLVFEPALPDGSLAAGRKGSGNFVLQVAGRTAHAGRDHALGRNAIRALAELTLQIDDLNGQRPGVTINPATVHGGGVINRVPDFAQLRFNVRVRALEDAAWVSRMFEEIESTWRDRDGFRLELHGDFHRPPKPRTQALEQLFGHYRDIAQTLDVDLRWDDTGGCCDGNNLAAAGVVNLDTLGVVGGDIHSDREWMEVSSLAERACLNGRFLRALARDDIRLDPTAEPLTCS